MAMTCIPYDLIPHYGTDLKLHIRVDGVGSGPRLRGPDVQLDNCWMHGKTTIQITLRGLSIHLCEAVVASCGHPS